MIGVSLFCMRNAIDITRRLGCAKIGCMPVSVRVGCLSSMPNIFGILGPWMSMSNRPIFCFCCASVAARFAEMVLFPTPPFPLRTNMMYFICLIFFVNFRSWAFCSAIFVP